MTNKTITRFTILGLAVSLLVNVCALILIAQGNVARDSSSTRASRERQDLRKQNDYIICVLQILPNERTDAVVENCRAKTIGD